MKRTKSMEFKAIRQQLQESPPPAPSGTTIREWFAGLALMNPVLMTGVEPADRATEAVRLADELVKALEVPRIPSRESMAPPSAEELERWGRDLRAKTPPAARETRPDIAPARLKAQKSSHFRFSVPPPDPADPGRYILKNHEIVEPTTQKPTLDIRRGARSTTKGG